jgi:hypothetical protein
MPVDDGFTVRAFRDGDEEAILELFARSFPHAPRSRAHFDWKYRRNPFGNAHISLTVADAMADGGWHKADGGSQMADGGASADRHPPSAIHPPPLVGHYAGYLVPFRIDGHDVLAHQVGDTMTAVSVRHVGRGPTGILGRTALHFYATFCEGKIAFNYGFNVANIQKFSLRFLRADAVEPVSYRVRELPLAPLPRWQRWLRGYSLELVRATTPEWDALFERVSGAYRFLVKRDAAYVRWRYFECPDVPYVVVAIRKLGRLAGWAVFRMQDRTLLWGDALFDPHFEDAPEVLLRHFTAGHDLERIEAWFPPRPQWFDARLRDLGFASQPQPQNLSVMCVPFVLADASAQIRDGLYYSWGDSDLF